MGKGKEGIVKRIETMLKIITYAMPIAQLISIFFLPALLPTIFRWIGVLIGAMGVFIFVISVVTMKDNWRAGVSESDKTELVTDGIYRISRNPAFLGFDLMYIGIVCMFFNWFLMCVTALAIYLFHLQIVNVEEDFLVSTFQDEYIQYKKKVNRYLGRRC